MRKIRALFVLCFLFLHLLCLGQSHFAFAFEDALQLRTMMDPEANQFAGKDYIPIIKQYSFVANESQAQFETRMKENPFLAPFVTEDKQNKDKRFAARSISSLATSLSGLDVTNFADGLAKFLAERAKEELAITFFDRLKTALNDNPDFELLLPNTVATLKLIDEKIYDFKRYIGMIREAFYADLKALPKDLTIWLAKGNIPKSMNPETRAFLTMGALLTSDLMDGKHPGEMLHDLSKSLNDNFALEPKFTTAISTISSLDLLSQSLRSSSGEQYWLPEETVQKADIMVWKIYCGLLWEEYTLSPMDKSVGEKENPIKVLLTKLAEEDPKLQNISGFIGSVRNIAKALANAEDEFKALQTPEGKNNVPQHLSNLTTSVHELLAQSKTVATLIKVDPPAELDSLIFYSGQLSNIANAIQAKHYSSAVAQTAIVVQRALQGHEPAFVEKLFTYGGFLALLAEAETADDVQNAIELYAMPAGSARVKKESRWNIAVQAYVGGFYQPNVRDSALSLFGSHFGITSPVGLSFSKGFSMGKNARSSISLFLSAVDLGSLVHYRLTNPNDTLRSRINLGSIVSPGAGIVWGLPCVPISWGVTYSAGPLLRGINEKGEVSIDTKGNLWGLRTFIAVDIPLFNLYNSTKKDREHCPLK